MIAMVPSGASRGRRSRGFALVEVMLGAALIVVVALLTLSLAMSQRSQMELSASYVRDVTETRRALDILERDLRARRVDPRTQNLSLLWAGAGSPGDAAVDGARVKPERAPVVFFVKDGVLWRDANGASERIHSNVERMDVTTEGALTHVVLTLGSRARRDGRRARVATTVRCRLEESP